MTSVTAATTLSSVFVPALSAIATMVLGALVRWGYLQLQRNFNEGRQESAAMLAKILTQTTATNGRVTVLEHDTATIRERVAKVEGIAESTLKAFEAVTKGNHG